MSATLPERFAFLSKVLADTKPAYRITAPGDPVRMARVKRLQPLAYTAHTAVTLDPEDD